MSHVASGSSPLTGTILSERAFWIVDGRAYDFSDWMKMHPGGAIWFKLTRGRDISVLFHVMHRKPERLRSILEKYRLHDITPNDLLPKMGLPPFLLDPDFNASTDLPRFDFEKKGNLLRRVREEVGKKLGARSIRRYDRLFDLSIYLLIFLHVMVLAAVATSSLPLLLCGLLWVLTRTALAGGGHYHLHRGKKPDPLDALFDMNYVGTCLIGADGHVLLHHPHLGSGADVKRTFFDGMMCVHPALRVVAYTVHKLGVFFSGMCIRGIEVLFLELKDFKRHEFWFVRAWLLLELMLCVLTGHVLFWFLQFVVTLWYNTFLVVASHEFEREHAGDSFDSLPEPLRGDWAAQQVHLSYDLSITGIRWIDLFLSSGLSPHRVHHLLPTQRSGFSNIASEGVVREIWKESGLDWHPPKNFIFSRLPILMKRVLLQPAKAKTPMNLKPDSGYFGLVNAVATVIQYSLSGWKGAGSI